MNNNPKVLIFTSAYSKRAYMMRQSMLSSLNQTYENRIHAFNITLDADANTLDFLPLYDDLLSDKISVVHSQNLKSHFNNMNTIRSIPNYLDYDIYVKMDDDDIYKKDYVKNIVDCFLKTDADIVSTKIQYQLNGYDLRRGPYNNLGGVPENRPYHMPNTYAFNQKALMEIINLTEAENFGYDDMVWRVAWDKAGLSLAEADNKDQVIWNIHGGNTSTGDFLIKKENPAVKRSNFY